MPQLLLEQFHTAAGASFCELGGWQIVSRYSDPGGEYRALRDSAGLLDLGFRGRLCLLGADRQKFLNGQVTNNVKDLRPGQGIYAALVNAKGKMQSDLRIHCLDEELLLDFEPGLSELVWERLEKHIVADDVQMVDVEPHFGLLSLQGPLAASILTDLGIPTSGCATPWTFSHLKESPVGEAYLMNAPRLATAGFDLFVPNEGLATAWDLLSKCPALVPSGWAAFETSRIEAGIPRFGADMTEANLPPEAGLDANAISYTKGCYIGQEVIARIRTYGQVAKSLRGLMLSDDLGELPSAGDKLFRGDKEAGYVTSSTASPRLGKNIALGYVRREANRTGTELTLKSGSRESPVRVVSLPFGVGV